MYSSRTSTDKQFLTIPYLSFPDSPLFSDCKKVETWHLKTLLWLPWKGSAMRALSWDINTSAVKVANGCCNSHKAQMLQRLLKIAPKILSLKHFLIYMKRWINQHDSSVGQRKNQSLTGIEPMTWTQGESSIYWAMTTHGEQGWLTKFIIVCDHGHLADC